MLVEFGPRQTFALSVVSALAWISFAALPYEIGVFVESFGLPVTLAGWLAAAELLTLATVAAWLGRTIDVRDKRKLVLFGLTVGALSSIACLFSDNLATVLVARLAFGAGMGAVAAATSALPTYHRQPERIFAYMMIGLALVFSMLMFLGPLAIGAWGSRGLFALELALLVLIGPFAISLPSAVMQRSPQPGSLRTRPLPAGTRRTLVGLALTLVGQGTCWAFAEQAAASLKITGTSLAVLFTVSGLLSLAGALAATALGLRIGYARALYIGYAVQIYTGLGMYCLPFPYGFASGVLLLNAAGMFALPYIQGVLAELDDSGRSAALSGAAINFGAGAGPAAGAVLSLLPGLKPIGVATTVMFVCSLALVLSGKQFMRERSGL